MNKLKFYGHFFIAMGIVNAIYLKLNELSYGSSWIKFILLLLYLVTITWGSFLLSIEEK